MVAWKPASVAALLIVSSGLVLPGGATLHDDDAGSGMDAPDNRTADVWITSGNAYQGNMTGPGTDPGDFYAFSGQAGETVSFRAEGVQPCVRLWRPTGGTAYQDCNLLNGASGLHDSITLDADGTWFFSYEASGPDQYRFSIGIDEPAPPLQGLSVDPQDDAGSGQDAPTERVPEVWLESGRPYQGNTTGPVGDPQDAYAFPAAAGQSLHVQVFASQPCFDIYAPGDDRFYSECGVQTGEVTSFGGVADATGTWYLVMRPLGPDHYRFGIGVGQKAPDLLPVHLPGDTTLPPGEDPTCGGRPASETTATHGAGDAAMPSLVWAATKTGFRTVIAWESEAPTLGSVTVNVAGGPDLVLQDAGPRSQHVFFIDGLDVGRVLCFQAQEDGLAPRTSAWHGLTLRNGPTAYDDATGTYTLNTVSLGNEAPGEAHIVRETEEYGERLYDATDGHVQAGRNLVLFYDVEHHNSGWATCFTVGSAVLPDVPGCSRMADILYTNDALPLGAASTQKDAIEDPDGAIWMNWYWQGAPVGLDDTGQVLMHEMGHYAFGAQDLYVSGSCWVPSLKLSVMGGNRAATEFDDEVNRCPNENQLSGYVPTWTLMRDRFPEIPDRTTITFGPDGGGPHNHVHAFGSLVHEPPGLEQDDAGSGGDAPDARADEVQITPGVVYQGNTSHVDSEDWYAFDADAGDALQAKVVGIMPCVELRRPDGSTLMRGCNALAPGPVTLDGEADQSGTWYLRVAPVGPQHYRFAVGIDGAAPEPLDPLA